jgi:hypothetical protein
MTTKLQKSPQRFAICINTDNEDMLTPRMVYQVLPDESAAKSDYIRVVDNEGEDYLYPAKYFVFVDFPQPVKRALLRAQPLTIGSVSTRRSRVPSAQRKNL